MALLSFFCYPKLTIKEAFLAMAETLQCSVLQGRNENAQSESATAQSRSENSQSGRKAAQKNRQRQQRWRRLALTLHAINNDAPIFLFLSKQPIINNSMTYVRSAFRHKNDLRYTVDYYEGSLSTLCAGVGA